MSEIFIIPSEILYCISYAPPPKVDLIAHTLYTINKTPPKSRELNPDIAEFFYKTNERLKR